MRLSPSPIRSARSATLTAPVRCWNCGESSTDENTGNGGSNSKAGENCADRAPGPAKERPKLPSSRQEHHAPP